MNLPNKISIFRLLLVPAIVASLVYYAPDRDGLRFLALALFCVAMVSDAVDGYIARRQGLQTELGRVLDPIADKCLILATLISCSVINGLPEWMRVPAWFNLIVISRDAFLVAGTLVLFVFTGKFSVQPSRLGKIAVALQMSVVPIVLLGWPIKGPLLIGVAIMTVCSGIAYVRRGTRLIDE